MKANKKKKKNSSGSEPRPCPSHVTSFPRTLSKLSIERRVRRQQQDLGALVSTQRHLFLIRPTNRDILILTRINQFNAVFIEI